MPASAQRRPEHKLRRHRTQLGPPERLDPAALNEGRSINSGDTSPADARSSACPCTTLNEGRSINSGDTSARKPPTYDASIVSCAQRRPEHKLRRHPGSPAGLASRKSESLNEGRSINSGDTRVDRAVQRARPSPLNEGRSINSGDTPAPGNAPPHPRTCPRSSALNEGRSINSGDTAIQMTPRLAPRPLNEGRSINSGDTLQRASAAREVAQRRPEHKLRRHC